MSSRSPVRPTFGSIVCGVDGSRASDEAARQAELLTVDGATLTYVDVTPDELAEDERGPAGKLAELAAGQDLLVVGIHDHSRASGIAMGSIASALVHRSPVPVLVARRPPDGVEFPARILLASDGTPLSDEPTDLVARLAARHGSAVAIVGARDGEAPFRPGLAEHATRIMEATGTEPLILDAPGPAHRAAADAARDFRAALVVTGSRGLRGLSALRSTSERIAHAAPCSVLVVRPG
jgi:nucleotide-binding universal stress UspA family protein